MPLDALQARRTRHSTHSMAHGHCGLLNALLPHRMHRRCAPSKGRRHASPNPGPSRHRLVHALDLARISQAPQAKEEAEDLRPRHCWPMYVRSMSTLRDNAHGCTVGREQGHRVGCRPKAQRDHHVLRALDAGTTKPRVSGRRRGVCCRARVLDGNRHWQAVGRLSIGCIWSRVPCTQVWQSRGFWNFSLPAHLLVGLA